jgi:hypothetical protein
LINTYNAYEEAMKTASKMQKAELRKQFTVGAILIAFATTVFIVEEGKIDNE